MAEVGKFQLTDKSEISEVAELMVQLEDVGYVLEERLSDGEIMIRTRENETLSGSAKEDS